MTEESPKVVVIGGPNGAGKTTIARRLLPKVGIRTFVNADIIAQGLSMFDSESVALAAGRIMLSRLRELASEESYFAFETTLASRTFATWLKSLIALRYEFDLYCVWVPSPDVSINRIRNRVLHGGHFVPDDTVRRRYAACFANFFRLYLPIATTWTLLNNSTRNRVTTIATGGLGIETEARQVGVWRQLQKEFGNDDPGHD